MKQVWQGNVVLPDRILADGQIVVEAGRIIYVGKWGDIDRYIDEDYVQVFASNEGYLWPGLIDMHIHGAGGADVMDGSYKALTTIARTLLSCGVTGFLPTTLSAPIDSLKKTLEMISYYKSENGAEILGVHLEGPWLNPNYIGAQNKSFIQTPQTGEGRALFNAAQGELKLVTIAPEIENGFKMIEELKDLGVIVSIGHSGATYEEVNKAIALGASNITHTYNAMSGFHHRELGVVGSALLIDQLHCEIIADGLHVHPLAIKGLHKFKSTNNIILVSDSIRGVGMPEGIYDLGGLEVRCEGGVARLDDGTIAGSLLTLNKAVINMMNYAEVPIWEAVCMASLNPARLLRLNKEIGSIEIGKRANLVAVDFIGEVKNVWIDGIAQKI